MSRIRSVHPGLFTDEAFVGLSMAARILVIGIWTEADDHGVFEWKPLSLKMRIFPADDADVAALLSEAVAGDVIRQFEHGGKTYGAVRNFRKYQRPKKPSYKHPFPDELRTYVALGGESSEPVPHQYPTSTEKSPQREDVGGRKKEEGEKKKDSRTVAKATRPKMSDDFENFWKAYPRRLGANPKSPASKVFLAAVKQGAEPAAIIEGARRCAVADKDKIGTPYIPQAVKWLRDQRWADYAAGPPASPSLQAPAGAPTHDELRKKYERSAAIPAEAEAQSPIGANGSRADHGQELRPEGLGIRPSLRSF